MNRPNARKRLNLDDRVESITDSDTSEFPLENEISDEYIKYHSKPTEQLDGELTNAESTKFAIPPSREGDERKESGEFWKNFFKEQHTLISGWTEHKDKHRKRRQSGKHQEGFTGLDWEGWWIRSSWWRRLEGLMVVMIFIFTLAQLFTCIWLFTIGTMDLLSKNK